MADELRPGDCVSVPLDSGQRLSVTALAGSQAAELIAHSAEDPRDRLSTLVTALAENIHEPSIGTHFWSQDYHPLFTILEQSHSHHDMTLEACNPGLQCALDGSSDRRSCFENFRAALAGIGLDEKWIPYPFGIFRRTGVLGGRFQLVAPASIAGDFVRLEAESPLFVVVSACPMGAPKAVTRPTIRVEVG